MIFAVIGQLLMKKGVSVSELAPNFLAIVKTVLNPYLFGGLISYALSALIWLFVLQRFPLSVAYPAISLTYIIIVILSYFLFQEPLTYIKLSGVILIISGVFLLFK